MYLIEKEPAYQLYQFTVYLYNQKENDFFKRCNKQIIYRTLINRAYYSSYSIAEAWLLNNHGKSIISPKKFKQRGKKIKSVHAQVRILLEEFNHKKISSKLMRLQELRGKADYELYHYLSDDELNEAIKLMKYVVNNLKNMEEK